MNPILEWLFQCLETVALNEKVTVSFKVEGGLQNHVQEFDYKTAVHAYEGLKAIQVFLDRNKDA